MKPTLLILAAGLGSRFGSLKQIEKLGPSGETLMDYSIYDAICAGFGKAVFIIRKNIEQEFKEVFLNKFSDKIKIDYALQEIDIVPKGIKVPSERKKPWGTGHAVLLAESKIKEPFVVINADDFYGAESFKKILKYLSAINDEDDNHYCIVGYKFKNTLSKFGDVSRGICEVDKDGYLKSLTERKHILITQNGIVCKDGENNFIRFSGDEITSMNLMGFTPSVFKFFKYYFEKFIQDHYNNFKAEFYLPEVVNDLVQSGAATVKVLNSTEKWFGITYKEDKVIAVKKLQELINKNLYPENLWKQ